jgi:transcriptional regulator with XRE-family HTH domain
MRKSIHSSQNQILLAMLRKYRQQRRLRQLDVGNLLGRNQAMVSKVESGERRLDVIELRSWLQAIDVDFLTFMRELDDKLSSRWPE